LKITERKNIVLFNFFSTSYGLIHHQDAAKITYFGNNKLSSIYSVLLEEMEIKFKEKTNKILK